MTSMDELVAEALDTGGRGYLDAEARLRAGGAEAAAALQRHLAEGTRLRRLVARVLLSWVGGKAPQFSAALDGIRALGVEARGTPEGRPEPTAVAYHLDSRFGDSVVDVLAVRLVKESEWPSWKTRGVLLYLAAHHPETVAAALARYVVQSRGDEELRQARAILARVVPAERQACLHEEEQRLAQHRETLPPAVKALLEP
jgi:hypothetical protein